MLAICIRIQGIHNVPQRNTKNYKPLKAAIKEAVSHFQSLCPNYHLPGLSILERLISIPLFTSEYFEDISNNFQNIIKSLGERCCGDEKLFHFTGQSCDLRFIPNKPARIGFWFYELCVPLRYGGQFLLHTRLSHGGEGLPVHEVVQQWIKVMKKFPNDNPLLTIDSYYMDNHFKNALDKSHVLYIASFSSNRFKTIQDHMQKKSDPTR